MKPRLKQFEYGKFSPNEGEKINQNEVEKINKRFELEGKEKEKKTATIYNLDDYREDVSPAKRGLGIDKNDEIRMALDLETAKEDLVRKEADLQRLLDKLKDLDLASEFRKNLADNIKALELEIEKDKIKLRERE